MEHIQTLFSSQATKAWVAGLVAVIAAYLVPLISQWVASLTPEMLTAWLQGYGLSLPYALAAALVGLVGVVWTYVARNSR